ncbi:MAG: chemotaxis protein CheC [Thermotogaceae bacterium]|jgi:chemotaxis protein CheC|nr:chemotaxis protein CheC [Thermotogaceae bacterium]
MSVYDKLEPFHFEALKEIGNIGTGNAATSLSTMMNKKVEITVPDVSVVEISKIPFMFKDPEKVTVGIQMSFFGDLNGQLLLIFDSEPAKQILKLLIGQRSDDLTQMDEMQRSVFSELGNIVCGSYLVSLSQFTNLNLNSEVPQVTFDMVSAIVAESCLTYAEEEDKSIVIETEFEIESQVNVEAYLFQIMEPNSIPKLLNSIGM